MRIAMTGSSGTVGTALRGRLEVAGHEVVRIRYGEASNPEAQWDPSSGWIREGCLDGAEAVVHLAGVSIGDSRWTDAAKAEMRSTRIGGAKLLVETMRGMATRPAVFVSASAVGYYGDRGEEQLTEEASRGSGFLADLVSDWEAAAQEAESLGVRVVSVRTAIVPRSFMPKLITPFRLGLGGKIGSGDQYMAWIGFEDLLRIYEHAITSEIAGPVNAAAPQELTNAEFTKALGRAIRRPTVFPLPGFMLKLVVGGEKAAETVLVSQRVVPRKLLDAGWEFTHPTIEEALPAELAAI